MKILLLLDYDGTLTPLRSRPELARLPHSRLAFLKKLARNPRLKLAIISGRSLSSLKKMVPLQGAVLIGNHGLEMEIAGRQWRHPAVKKFRPRLEKIKMALGDIKKFPGVWIEDKGGTISLHYRQLPSGLIPSFLKWFQKIILRFGRGYRLIAGKKVLELRPPVKWNKGSAALMLIDLYPDHLPIALGDDLTDEDVFSSLKKQGLSFKVGPGKSAADLRLSGVTEVYRFLKLL